MYVCMHVCMYVCLYIHESINKCVYIYRYIDITITTTPLNKHSTKRRKRGGRAKKGVTLPTRFGIAPAGLRLTREIAPPPPPRFLSTQGQSPY